MEGEFHSVKHASSPPHLVKDRARLGWEWSAGSQLTNFMSHPTLQGPVTKGWSNGIQM